MWYYAKKYFKLLADAIMALAATDLAHCREDGVLILPIGYLRD